MADFLIRYPRNAPGKFYVDRNCLDCAACYQLAPQFFVRDDTGYSYVKIQPTDAVAIDLCQKAMESCPTNAVGNEGDAHDWDASPIMAWDNLIDNEELRLKSPVVSRLDENRSRRRLIGSEVKQKYLRPVTKPVLKILISVVLLAGTYWLMNLAAYNAWAASLSMKKYPALEAIYVSRSNEFFLWTCVTGAVFLIFTGWNIFGFVLYRRRLNRSF